MHKLFPEAIPADDPTGSKSWDYDWFVNNTGSKWPPEVIICEHDDATYLSYDTARAWSQEGADTPRVKNVVPEPAAFAAR